MNILTYRIKDNLIKQPEEIIPIALKEVGNWATMIDESNVKQYRAKVIANKQWCEVTVTFKGLLGEVVIEGKALLPILKTYMEVRNMLEAHVENETYKMYSVTPVNTRDGYLIATGALEIPEHVRPEPVLMDEREKDALKKKLAWSPGKA